MTLTLVFTPSLLDAQYLGRAWRTSRQVYLLCRWERHLTEFPHLGVIDRWPATFKLALIALHRFLVIGMPIIIIINNLLSTISVII